jgi:hypothetical protein
LSRVTVYQFRLYDIGTDEHRKSRRWATLEAIAQIGGEALTDTAIEVDAAMVGTEIAGMTERGFDPHKRTGFQQTVTG